MNENGDNRGSPDKFLRLCTPPTILYQPNFITEDEEKLLISHVNSAPKPKWQQLAHRRLQNWGGIPHPKGMIAEPIPQWLMKYVTLVGNIGLFGGKQPNHVLVNEYLPGQGIMPHTDGPLFHPVITTISLGSHTVLDFCEMPKDQLDPTSVLEGPSPSTVKYQKLVSVLVEPRSLLVVKDDMYREYMHAISEVTEDILTESIVNLGSHPTGKILPRGVRISLTIRHVPKTSKAKICIGR